MKKTNSILMAALLGGLPLCVISTFAQTPPAPAVKTSPPPVATPPPAPPKPAAPAPVPPTVPPASVPAATTAATTAAAALQVQMDAALDRFFTPLKALPFPACGSSSWSTAIDALRKGLTAPTNGWRESGNTCGLQLYVEQIPPTGVPMNAAIYVVFDKGLKLSDIPNLKGNKWKNIADAELNRPVFSIASVERTMTTADGKMPAGLRGLFGPGSRYAGLQQFTVPVGPQLFTHASLKGTVGKFLKEALNAPIDNLWIRSGFASESASDLLNREGSKFLEVLLPPGTTLSGPLGITEVRVSDATIQIDDAKNVSLMGNMSFESAAKGKVFPAVLDLPATPAGSIDWTKAQMALSTPSVITMEEFAKVSLAFNTQVAGGGIMTEIAPAKTVLNKIATLFKPLSTFKLTNPNPNADSFRLKAGNDYPELSKFNFVILSKSAKAKDGSNKEGPILRLKAGIKVFGKQLANTNTDLSTSGLHTDTTGSFGMDLKSVGNYTLSAKANIHIDDAKQDVSVSGSFNTPVIGRSAIFAFNPNEIAFTSPATCVVPVEFGTKIPLTGDPSIESIASGLNPVKVDVGKLVGCTKEQLEAAAKWVGNAAVDAGKAVGGTVVDAGKVVGGAVVDGAKATEDAAKAAAKASEEAAKAASRATEAAATAAANAASNAARAAANAAVNAAKAFVNNPAKAVMSIGNAFGGSGKKVCNERIEWLRARGNVPNPQETQHMIDHIYLPLLTRKEEARALANYIQGYAANLSRAHEGFRALEQHWNEKAPASVKIGPLNSFHEGETHVFDYQGRINQMRANADYLDKGDSDLQALLGWKTYAGFESPGGWRGKNEGEWLWARCAAAWTADIPIRTAQAWGINVPLHRDKQGHTHPDAMFMGRADYVQLRSQVAARVNEKGTYTDQAMAWVNGFSSRWAQRTLRFQTALALKFDENLGPTAGQLRANPPTDPKIQPLWKEYLDALAAYRAQTEAMASLANLPNRQQTDQTIDRVLRATEALRKART